MHHGRRQRIHVPVPRKGGIHLETTGDQKKYKYIHMTKYSLQVSSRPFVLINHYASLLHRPSKLLVCPAKYQTVVGVVVVSQ